MRGPGAARAFVALPLGAELGARVGARVAGVLAGGPWRCPAGDGLHLTLAFLGALAPERLAALERELARTLADARAPRLLLAGTGAFPSARRPRVLWIGLEERGAAGRLAACQRAVVAAVSAAGVALPPGETFHPHVTVARARGERAPASAAFGALRLDERWDPAAVVLLESRLGSGGSRYEPLASFPLEAAE